MGRVRSCATTRYGSRQPRVSAGRPGAGGERRRQGWFRYALRATHPPDARRHSPTTPPARREYAPAPLTGRTVAAGGSAGRRRSLGHAGEDTTEPGSSGTTCHRRPICARVRAASARANRSPMHRRGRSRRGSTHRAGRSSRCIHRIRRSSGRDGTPGHLGQKPRVPVHGVLAAQDHRSLGHHVAGELLLLQHDAIDQPGRRTQPQRLGQHGPGPGQVLTAFTSNDAGAASHLRDPLLDVRVLESNSQVQLEQHRGGLVTREDEGSGSVAQFVVGQVRTGLGVHRGHEQRHHVAPLVAPCGQLGPLLIDQIPDNGIHLADGPHEPAERGSDTG